MGRYYNKKTNQKKEEDWIKEKDELKKRVDELWEKRNNITPLDMNRIAVVKKVYRRKLGKRDRENKTNI